MKSILKLHIKSVWGGYSRVVLISAINDPEPREDFTLIRVETKFDNLSSGSFLWVQDRVRTDTLNSMISRVSDFKCGNCPESGSNYELEVLSSAAMIHIFMNGNFLQLGFEFSLSLGSCGDHHGNDRHSFVIVYVSNEDLSETLEATHLTQAFT